jgi:hypothetical protein
VLACRGGEAFAFGEGGVEFRACAFQVGEQSGVLALEPGEVACLALAVVSLAFGVGFRHSRWSACRYVTNVS